MPASGFGFRAEISNRNGLILGALALVVLLAYVPTGFSLAAGPWQTEQEGHGPFILAIAAWIVWTKRDALARATFTPSPLPGWVLLAAGLALFFVGRSQEVLSIECGAILPILAGVTLLVGGLQVFKILAFPIGILFFAAPPPGWLLDVLTIPLKSAISDIATRILYWFGYPVAQNGVVIMIGPYQLLVKDACAGMNSIFALSAIGVIYLYMMGYSSRLRNVLLLAAILPITVLANFVRVMALILIAYHFGSASVEGSIHDITGLALFAVAFVLLIAFDGLLAIGFTIAHRVRARTAT